MITSGVIVVAFNDAAAMTPIVTNKCEERGGRGRKREGGNRLPRPLLQYTYQKSLSDNYLVHFTQSVVFRFFVF